MKLNPKMGFEGQTRSNKNLDLKDQIGLIWGGEQKREGEREEEEEEEEEKKRKRGSSQDQAKVWKLTLNMNSMRFGMDPWLCRVIIFPKLGFLLGFHLNPIMMESKVYKTLNSTRSS